ncbi:sperm-associated antigen 17 isoform X2 [Onychostoma macrolepis]|uniref:sperm-associated antigen 17 isoform X2 n=1 Tax=Onychostoma macrolepis TaxID=369639 RepID=UPI00272C133C|nr:sperm-associated antigen 17 isoform X2 [Onychostoma macrolepis]
MPPKRNKSATPSGVTPTGPAAAYKNWETALTSAVFEENDWRASLSMVQAERAEDEQLISALLQAVQQPLRKLFSVLSWEDTLEKINELGNPKTRKTKDVPMFCEVTEVAKSIMDVGEEITVDLMAKLIKFQLLTIKNNDIARRAAEQKAIEDNAHAKARLNSAGKDQGGKGGAKGKKAAEPPAPTKDTNLKRRGEEENIIKYIDDEPDDGPQHYILIVGFCQPHLIYALDSLGIHVANIIKLGLEREDQSEAPEETVVEENHHSTEDQEVDTLKQKRQGELDVFWKQLDQVLNSGNMGSRLGDVARLNYSVKIHLLPQDKSNTEAMLAFGAAIFERVACLVYDSLDWRRQYSHYLSCMRLIQVPEACRSIQQSRPQSSTEVLQTPRKKVVSEEDPAELESPVLSTEVDMRYYCDLLDRIPTEITSVPLILHCMLEQVLASEQEGSVDSQEHFNKTDQDLISYMLSSVLSLPQDEEDKKQDFMEDLDMQKSPKNTDLKHPLLLNHHDERARRLHQLPVLDGFDVIKIEADIMKQSHVWTNLMSRHTESAINRLTRSQELLHFCTDKSMSWSELQRLLQLFVFESMPLTTVDENGCIKGSPSDPPNPTPWDNPVEFTKHLYWSNRRIPGSAKSSAGNDEQTSHEVTVPDLQKSLIRQLGHWNFVEKHSAHVFPQVLQSAWETYRCVDTFYCSRDNAIYVICHNPMSPQSSCKEFWDASLHTDVGFRNYLEYVADSISEWTRQEEEKWQMEQEKKEAERTPIQTPSETDRKRDSPISDTLEPYIREDSLKAWKIEQERLKEEEQSKKTKKEKGGKATPKVGERIDSVKENKKTPLSSRKSRDNMSKTPSSATLPRDKTRDILETPQEPANEMRTNVFTGYNLNGKLVQIAGKVQTLYPCDGGQIDVESFHFTQGLTEVKVCVNKDGHHFYTHISERKKEDKLKDFDMFSKQAADGVKPDCETEKFGSFHAVLANGIQLSCSQSKTNKTRGQTLQPPVPNAICTDQQLQEQCVSEVPEVHCEPRDDSALPLFLNLHVSLPNGLILYFDCEDSADGDSCVRSLLLRQRFYNAGSRSDLTSDFSIHTEVSRVITGRGTVIKHKTDGSTEVLFADGTVSTSPDSGPVCVLVPRTLLKEEDPIKEMTVDTKDKKGKADSKVNTEDEQQKSTENEKTKYYLEINGGSWTTTTPSGFRVASVAGKEVKVQPILAYHATDPFSGTAVVTREDKVLSVLKKDGTVIVDHADGTRVTTFYKQGELQQHLSSGEKLVWVEKAEFATVIMDYEGRACDVIFGDGTSISATAHGSYQIYPHGGGVLHIDKEGGTVYTSHQSQEQSERNPLGQYVMNHRADILCHVTDPEGNHFQVNADGQVTITANVSETKEPEPEAELQQNAGFKTHPPRLFVVHEDCSASELLRAQDVEDLLQKAYCDSSIAVLTDPLPDSQQSFGNTLLRPCPDVNSHWLSSKQDNDNIPTHLKSRKWESFPASEKKTPGPPFGTTLGCSLELKEKPPKSSSIRIHPVLECPDVLLVHQMTQHPPVTEALRRNLQDKVKAYLEQLLQRENQWEKMELKDPRTAEEKVHQNDLLQLVLSLSDAVDPPVAMEIRPLSADVASLYTQAVRVAPHPHELQEKREEKVTKCVNKKKQKSLWENRINQHRQELQEQRRHRNTLRQNIVTPYFHPELKEMSLFTDEDLDLSSLSLDLPPFPRVQRFSTDSSSGRSSSCDNDITQENLGVLLYASKD